MRAALLVLAATLLAGCSEGAAPVAVHVDSYYLFEANHVSHEDVRGDNAITCAAGLRVHELRLADAAPYERASRWHVHSAAGETVAVDTSVGLPSTSVFACLAPPTMVESLTYERDGRVLARATVDLPAQLARS